MRQKGKELMESYKEYRTRKQSGETSDHMTVDGILIERERGSHIGRSAGKEDTV